MIRQALLWLAVLGACKSKRRPDDVMPEPEVVRDASVIAVDAAKPWPELDGYPRTPAARTIALPSKPDLPRFEVGGPVISGDIAVVSSSQIGFVGVDWKKGAIAWTKPAALHVAPPILTDGGFALIGECANPPAIPDGETLLGCLRVVDPAGHDLAYIAIRGRKVDDFAAEKGEHAVWRAGERLVWRRGERAVSIDPVSGIARPIDATPPPLHVTYKDRAWDISQDDGKIVARGKHPWATEHPYTAVLGAVYLPEMSPMIRVANAGSFLDAPEISVMDIDATGSLHAAFAKPAPGISLLAHAMSSVGDAALVVRLDASLRRDYVVGYAANAMLMWVYPLPEHQRQTPVGVGISEEADAVVVFHDGDTVTVLPDLSAPPTTPGAARASSKKPTP